MSYQTIRVPVHGEKIHIEDAKLSVPDHLILPYVEGDGIGPDIWRGLVRRF